MLIRPFFSTIALVFLPVGAQATNPGFWDLWALEVATVCFAQNPEYIDSPLGNRLMQLGDGLEGRKRFEEMPITKCLRGTPWASSQFCAEVTNLNEKTFRNLGPLKRKYAVELDGLRDVFAYVEKSRGPNADSVPCPDKDRARVNADPPAADPDETKAREYAFCSGVAGVMASSVAWIEIDNRRGKKDSNDANATAKEFLRMKTDFSDAARLRSSRAFVIREMYNVTDKLNELRLKEKDLHNALLKKESDRCRGVWVNEVQPLVGPKAPAGT